MKRETKLNSASIIKEIHEAAQAAGELAQRGIRPASPEERNMLRAKPELAASYLEGMNNAALQEK